MAADLPADFPAEADHPIPPRFRWTRRLLVAAGAYALGLVGLWLGWSWHADRRLEAAIAEVRLRREPLLVEDFNQPPIPNEQNAAYFLKQAAAAMDVNALSLSSMFDKSVVVPLPADWRAAMENSVGANQKSLELVRRARSCKQVNWELGPTSPAIFSGLWTPHFRSQRQIANLLFDAALLAHETGNDALAVEQLDDALFAADAVGEMETLLSHLIEIGCEALPLSALMLIAPDLDIAQDTSPTTIPSTADPATRRQVRELIAVLLNQGSRGTDARRAFYGERMLQTDAALYAAQGQSLLRPLLQLESVALIETHEPTLSAVLLPHWPSARTGLGRAPKVIGPVSAVFGMDDGSLERVVDQGFRARSEMNMAAVALAVRMYVLDHDRYPAKLEDLVPEYLPHVPVDPMAAEGTPLGYAILDGRPLVYSVGPDGVDHTANGARPPDRGQYGWEIADDQWRDLSRWPPAGASAPSSKAVDDDEDQSQ